jgi:hypothetical protein
MLKMVRTPRACAHRRDRFHRRVIVRSEQEREAASGDMRTRLRFARRVASAGRVASSTSALPERLEIERLPCSITAQTTGRSEQRRASGQVDAARCITTGADDVDRVVTATAGIDLRPPRERAHAAREATQLRRPSRPWRAAPRAVAPASAGDERTIGERDQQLAGASLSGSARRPSTTASSVRARGRLTHRRATARRMAGSCVIKRRAASGVSTLSGWNCTPSTSKPRMAHSHDLALGGLRRDRATRWQRIGLRDQESAAADLEAVWVNRRTVPGRRDVIGEVLPCIKRPARTTLPPKASTIDWCPRHTPNTGT